MVGRSLKRTHCKRHLVPSGKQVAYQLPETQGSLSSLKRVPRPLHTQDSTCSDRQHHSGVIHKQGRGHEVGPTLCKIIILIALGRPNMPWCWDLVTMSSQIPLSLPFWPNLLTQPFNQIPHRNLTYLNLHAWLLAPHQSRSRASLKQWQQELRLLKEDQPDQSMRQSGPFFTKWCVPNQLNFRAPPCKVSC